MLPQMKGFEMNDKQMQEPYGYVWFTKHMEQRFTRMKPTKEAGAMDITPVYTSTHLSAPNCTTSQFFDAYTVGYKDGQAAQLALVHALRSAIADDAWAISFQSLGQYRSALLKLIDTEQAAPAKG